jgi:alanine racemase
MHVATIPVGYAHGYSRVLSNQGRVLIDEFRLGVIGMVNMNMMMVDLTESSGIREGDEVILIGSDGEKEISVASFGELSKQLNYELLVRIPHNIPRLIVD